MGDKSKIEWTEATWNPLRGCSKVSEGCSFCYAESMAARFGGVCQPYHGLVQYTIRDGQTTGRWNGKVKLVEDHLEDPLRWKKPRRIFVNSMSDLFHEAVSFEDIAAIFGIMAAARQHTFQVLTKRAGRMLEWFRWIQDQPTGLATIPRSPQLIAACEAQRLTGNRWTVPKPDLWPLPNLWLGVSVENQAAAEERITLLRQVPAAIRWVSMEPLLGPVDLSVEYLSLACGGRYPFPMLESEHRTRLVDTLDWVVVGGESGPHARPMHIEHPRRLRGQCREAGVPYLFKQWGEWAPGTTLDGNFVHAMPEGPLFRSRAAGRDTHDFGDGYAAVRIGKKAAGRMLDGCLEDAYPG